MTSIKNIPILVIDNYDSFTFNLVQYIGELGYNITVWRNDAFDLNDIATLSPSHIVISPGPGRPSDAGESIKVIREYYQKIPILGVCLGHQAINEAFGGRTIHAPYLMHGKTSEIFHDCTGIFKNLTNPFIATRYHSLVIDEATLPADFVVTAKTSDNIIMGIRHKNAPTEGVQFHPESIMTESGKALLANFLEADPFNQQIQNS